MKQINPLTVGQDLPAFNLPANDGNTYNNQEFTGKPYLVYFYPKASTPGCTAQACSLEQGLQLSDLKLTILGVSPDSPDKNQRFAQKNNLSFTLLSDENHIFAQACGVWGEKKFMGKTYEGLHRIAFLINTTGKVAHVFLKVKTKEFAQQVKEALKITGLEN